MTIRETLHEAGWPLARAKGHAYYLYHSPEDRTCPFRMAESAFKELEANGAKVELVRYGGGHGWHGSVFDDIRRGIQWLDEHAASRSKVSESGAR